MTHPMIEKCARAIWNSYGPPLSSFDLLGDDMKANLCGEAIAVLRTLREPDDSMKVSGGIALEEAMFNGEPDSTVFDAAGLSFTAMIDSLLPEEKGTET